MKARIAWKLPPENNSSRKEAGSTAMAMRPTAMARSRLPNRSSTTRPPNWAKPFIEATQTATPAASPAASSSGTSCTVMTPKTKPFSDITSAKSAIPSTRTRPASGGPSREARACSSGEVASPAGSWRARPYQFNGRQTRRLIAANIISVSRQP